MKTVQADSPPGGKCLDNTQSVHGVLDCLPTESESQKWFIETDPEDSNIVAFKSAVDGQYLRNNMPHVISGARIGMGEKQWWTLEKGRNPGSCLIRSNACTIGGSYLNDFEGVYRDRNLVHMWQYVAHLQFWLDWYFLPTDASFHPKGITAAKEAAEPADGDLAKKTKDLEAKQAALDKKEKDLAQREAAVQKEKASKSTGTPAQKDDGSAAREASLKKREQELARQEEDLKKRMASMESTQQTLPATGPNGEQADGVPDGRGPDDNQLAILKAENENLKLKLRIQELEEQLRSTSKPARKPPVKTSRGGPPSNTSTNGLGKKDPVVYECGHVAYPPPRKLRRHVVGMLYEGLDQPFELSERQKATLARHEHHR